MVTSSSIEFWVLTPDGQEHGPFVREQLLELAANGELAADCKVRDSSVNEWTPWTEYSLGEAECQVSALDNFQTSTGERLARPLMIGMVSGRLGGSELEFSPASAEMRLLAGLTDVLVLAVWGLLVAWLCGVLPRSSSLYVAVPHAATVCWLAFGYAGALLYFTACYALRGQTVGQWFWGLVICTEDIREVWAWPAFRFALATLIAGWLSPLVVLFRDQRRSLTDTFCGTRVIRTRVVQNYIERIHA